MHNGQTSNLHAACWLCCLCLSRTAALGFDEALAGSEDAESDEGEDTGKCSPVMFAAKARVVPLTLVSSMLCCAAVNTSFSCVACVLYDMWFCARYASSVGLRMTCRLLPVERQACVGKGLEAALAQLPDGLPAGSTIEYSGVKAALVAGVEVCLNEAWSTLKGW